MAETTLSRPGSGYQSFVIRVFVDDAQRLDHGEVLHVSSRSRLRFNEWAEAMTFMTTFSDSGEVGQIGFFESPLLFRQAVWAESLPATSSARVSVNGHAVSAAEASLPATVRATVVRPSSRKTWQAVTKRLLDLFVSTTALLFLLIPVAFIALAIKLDSPGPVIHRQRRVGKDGEPFTMYKFRSMVDDAEDFMPALANQNESTLPIFKMRDDPRKTRVGAVLRRLSLDELPQLYNVFKGDLSLVGPRPPLASEIAVYSPEHWQRLSVPQGMTGLWQVSGRSLLKFDEMLELDLAYIANWSLWLDLRLLVKTIPAVLSGRGAF